MWDPTPLASFGLEPIVELPCQIRMFNPNANKLHDTSVCWHVTTIHHS